MAQTIKNLASGRLTADITAVATSLSVYVGEGTSAEIEGVWPDTPFYATIAPSEPVAGVPNSLDSEIVKITAVSSDQNGNTILTATRAQRGTLARAFSAGAIVTNAIYVEDAGFSVYSTEERVVGTWIDGKPIYRRVLTGTITNSANARATAILWANSPIEKLVNVGGWTRYGDSGINAFPLAEGGSEYRLIYVQTGSNNLTMAVLAMASYTDRPYEVWIEYTKKTD